RTPLRRMRPRQRGATRSDRDPLPPGALRRLRGRRGREDLRAIRDARARAARAGLHRPGDRAPRHARARDRRADALGGALQLRARKAHRAARGAAMTRTFTSLGATPRSPGVLVPFRFREVGGDVLLTSHFGDWVFVTKDELATLARGECPEGSALHE